ncbi:SRPBCC family protein [Streptomyces avermitilis]|uniref:SRPBCC family protein n=1 Tax=Streptomyces avermitilis TaxID=33903 RepID=UPI0036C561AB
MSTTHPETDTTRPATGTDTLDAADYAFTRSAWVEATPAAVYDLISDVSRIGTWSPSADEAAYDDGAGPWTGAWFQGRNHQGDREWTTRSQIVDARPGDTFAFVVGALDDGIVEWRWTFRADGPGTVVQQSWQLLRLDPVLGETRTELDALRDHMAADVEHTLIALARWLSERPSHSSIAE